MGSSINEPVGIHSSIALLQERFKKLQRVKELREGRELSQALAEPKWFNYSTARQQPEIFHPELIIQPGPSPPRLSLPLWPDHSQTQNKQQDPRCGETPTALRMSLWPEEKRADKNLWNKFDDSASDDIDTSLHL